MSVFLLMDKILPGTSYTSGRDSQGKQFAPRADSGIIIAKRWNSCSRMKWIRNSFRKCLVLWYMTVLQGSPLPGLQSFWGVWSSCRNSIPAHCTSTQGTFDEHTEPPVSHSTVHLLNSPWTEAGNPSILFLTNLQMALESITEGCLNFLDHFLWSFRGRQWSHCYLHGLELYAVGFWHLQMTDSNDRLSLPTSSASAAATRHDRHAHRTLTLMLPFTFDAWRVQHCPRPHPFIWYSTTLHPYFEIVFGKTSSMTAWQQRWMKEGQK